MAMENKRIIQLSTERTNLTSGDYVMVDSDADGSAKYRLDRLKETDSTLSVSGKAADAAATGQAISDEAEARDNADTALGEDISDLKSALSEVSGNTKNIFKFVDGTFNGVTFKYLPDGGLLITGTCTKTANNIIELDKGYWGQYSLSVRSVEQSFSENQLFIVLRKPDNSQVNSIRMNGTTGSISSTNSEAYQISKIDITTFIGITYNTVLYIQLEMQIPATDFVSPFTAIDRIVRESLTSTLSTFETDINDAVSFSVKTDNGKYVDSSNSTPSYATAIYTNLFKVKAGDTYYVNSCAFSNAQAYILLDENKNVISHENNETETWTRFEVLIPSTAKYMRCSSTRADYFYVIRKEERTGNNEIETTNNLKNRSVLTNKKWYACGDSFTHGDFSGVTAPYIKDGLYKNQLAVYPFLIGNRTNALVTSLAQNGATISETNESGVYALSRDGNYNSIPSDADYVTIMIGINDSGKNVPIGTIDDTTNTTFYGAWNTVLSWLRENRPFTKVGIIISLSLHDEYRVAELAIAKKYGYPYLNLPEDETLPAFLWAHRANISSDIQTLINGQQRVSESNFHPNENTHKLLSTVIQSWVESI